MLFSCFWVTVVAARSQKEKYLTRHRELGDHICRQHCSDVDGEASIRRVAFEEDYYLKKERRKEGRREGQTSQARRINNGGPWWSVQREQLRSSSFDVWPKWGGEHVKRKMAPAWGEIVGYWGLRGLTEQTASQRVSESATGLCPTRAWDREKAQMTQGPSGPSVLMNSQPYRNKARFLLCWLPWLGPSSSAVITPR